MSVLHDARSANKVASAAAELMEGRSGTERNAMMQSMVRTRMAQTVIKLTIEPMPDTIFHADFHGYCQVPARQAMAVTRKH